MRPVLVAAVVLSLLLGPAASASPMQTVARLASAQLSFDGLDLSDDDAGAKKGKKKSKKKSKTAAKKKKAHEKETADSASGDSAPPAALGSPTPAEPPKAVADEGKNGAIKAPGLDLTTPEAKPIEPPKKGKAAPVMSFEAVDVSAKSAERQRLDAAIKLFKEESYETAALAFSEILKEPKSADLHDEAQYMLAKSLYRLKMYHSALNQFKAILAKGPQNKLFKTCLEWLFYIAHKTVNEQIVLEEVAKYANQEFPERFRSEFRYLLARYHFARGKALDEAGQPEESKKSFAEAKRLILMIPRGDPFYAKVKYLEGTIAFKEESFSSALEAFKEVVRANNPRVNSGADVYLRELAFMQLARTHYGHKQNRYAIYYYDRVSRGSDQWLEALFEASWAHFRIGEYERALGNLITLSSPFFKDEYFPEALILKAVIYYENCRYREARAILEEFERTYMPVHEQLKTITAANTDAQGYWDILAEVQRRRDGDEKGTTKLLARILKLALTDNDLNAVNDSLLELEGEMDAISSKRDLFKYSDLAKGISEGLKVERAALMNKAGLLAKAKLEFELGQLNELLGNALRIKFETTTKEKEFLEAQLLSGGKKESVKSYTYSVAVSDERQYWPYEGEYWRDELGTYQYTLTKGCKGR